MAKILTDNWHLYPPIHPPPPPIQTLSWSSIFLALAPTFEQYLVWKLQRSQWRTHVETPATQASGKLNVTKVEKFVRFSALVYMGRSLTREMGLTEPVFIFFVAF